MFADNAIQQNARGTVTSPSSGNVHDFVSEGCNVLNGTVVGAAVGAILCPLPGGAEIGAAVGGWIGSKISEGSNSNAR